MQSTLLSANAFLTGKVANAKNETLAKICIDNQKPYSDDPTDSKNEDLQMPYSNEFQFVIDDIRNQYKDKFKQSLKTVEYWSQVHHYNQSSNLHNHVDTNNLADSPVLSGVYYVQVPKKAGKLVLQYYVNQYQTKRHWIEPEVGKFVIFPAYMDHFVTENKDSELRVSIAFNFKYDIINK